MRSFEICGNCVECNKRQHPKTGERYYSCNKMTNGWMADGYEYYREEEFLERPFPENCMMRFEYFVLQQ